MMVDVRVPSPLRVHTQGEKLVLNCRGEIVRVEVEGAKVGLAVKTRTSVLKS